VPVTYRFDAPIASREEETAKLERAPARARATAR
jgi:hypothetical protein